MMKHNLGDLNNHLFAELDRLNNVELEGEKLKDEVVRARAITTVAKAIIDNANTVIQAKQLSYQAEKDMPYMLEG